MKTLRFAIVAVAVAGSVSAFATNARVESMGKNSTFIMDDISIFDNPANINLYPNFLIGELGNYVHPGAKKVKIGENQDPWDPWFGGIFSLNLDASNSISIAGVLNRRDERLLKYFPTMVTSLQGVNATPAPVTNFDGFLGLNLDNKAFGLHVYIAHQEGLDDNGVISPNAFASALQLDAGTNIEISTNYSIEVAAGTARIQFGPTDWDFFDGDLFSLFGNIRLFSRLPAINGHLIPVATFRKMNMPGRDELDVGAGIGVDAAFDRGFFWLGLKGFYNDQSAGDTWRKELNEDSEVIVRFNDEGKKNAWGNERANLWQIGGTISFGIERNIWWDWFVLRVGGQKTIAYADYSAIESGSQNSQNNVLCPVKTPGAAQCFVSGNYFVTNPVNDGTRDDHVGFGFGINVEEKLKVDFSVAEDFMFRNPFQGEGRLISRVSATYSF
ncbi:MAG: hypothetical protein LBQ87_07740 [Candidatus Fibromonas sp.]|jgi:hypothetical protein|nr:hypothetical protein [Candidatus Fibromonas sp.]